MNPFFLLTLAAAISMLVIPLVRRWAPQLGLIDMPDPRKVHSVPIPRVGGWGIAIGMLLPLLLVLPPDPLLQSFVFGCVVLFAFGVWDDARTIGHWLKFAGQLASVGAVVYYGGLWVARVPFLDVSLPAAIGQPFTVFALIGVINAINHSDGLDGLAGGESVLSLIALASLGYLSGSALVLSVALATIGGIIGFLRFNSHPAYVFMGDCGSQVLGFTLGFLVVYLTQVASSSVSAALPLLVIGLPLADILSVLYQRVHARMNWFKATRNHIHHRLLDLGFDHYETVVIIYSIQALLVMCAVLARYQSDLAVALLYFAVVVGLFCALQAAERGGWRVVRARGAQSRVTRFVERLKHSRALLEGPVLVITVLTPLIILLGAFGAARIPTDIGFGAAALAVIPALQLIAPRRVSPMLVRIAVYITAIFPAYLLLTNPGSVTRELQLAMGAVIVLLGAPILLYLRFGARERFGTTPTDYLVVCGIVALAVFGIIDTRSRTVVELVVFATVLMYGCEIIIDAANRRVLQFSTLATLLVIAVRGVL